MDRTKYLNALLDIIQLRAEETAEAYRRRQLAILWQVKDSIGIEEHDAELSRELLSDELSGEPFLTKALYAVFVMFGGDKNWKTSVELSAELVRTLNEDVDSLRGAWPDNDYPEG